MSSNRQEKEKTNKKGEEENTEDMIYWEKQGCNLLCDPDYPLKDFRRFRCLGYSPHVLGFVHNLLLSSLLRSSLF